MRLQRRYGNFGRMGPRVVEDCAHGGFLFDDIAGGQFKGNDGVRKLKNSAARVQFK
jgi:hypothetical protein